MEVINNNPSNNHPRRYPPKNHLVEAILVTLFCCLPFGIVGIVNAGVSRVLSIRATKWKLNACRVRL